jgi:hypothetical protein
MARAGAGEILLTSMDRDGTRSGYDLALVRAVADAVSVPVIASGGGGSAESLAEALDDGPSGGHAQAALAASIFHFGEATVGSVKRRLLELGIAVEAPARLFPGALRQLRRLRSCPRLPRNHWVFRPTRCASSRGVGALCETQLAQPLRVLHDLFPDPSVR